jgi:hypothetical protein
MKPHTLAIPSTTNPRLWAEAFCDYHTLSEVSINTVACWFELAMAAAKAEVLFSITAIPTDPAPHPDDKNLLLREGDIFAPAPAIESAK